MDREYQPLPIRELGANAGFRRPLAPPAHRTMVRGIFSISQIARQLGVAVPTGGEVARTFSEIESAIK